MGYWQLFECSLICCTSLLEGSGNSFSNIFSLLYHKSCQCKNPPQSWKKILSNSCIQLKNCNFKRDSLKVSKSRKNFCYSQFFHLQRVLLSIPHNKLPNGFVFAQSGTESMIAIMQKAHFAVNIFLFDCQNWLCNLAFLTNFIF